MSRYTSHVKREERPWRIHPIWRGIGCLWLILLPVMSYAASWLIVRQVMLTSGFRSFIDRFYISSGVNLLPQSMYNRVVWPSIQLNQFYLDFNVLLRLLPGQPLYNMDFLIWFTMVFVGFGISSLVYALLYRSFGPPRSPYEAVEERYRPGPFG